MNKVCVKGREILEPEATIDGHRVAVDQPLSVLDPAADFSWWALAELRAAKVGAVELLYSPPYMLQISNQESRVVVATIPRRPLPIVIEAGDHARVRLMGDGVILVDNPDPTYIKGGGD